MADSAEAPDYDEYRPAKKVKLEAPLDLTMATQSEAVNGDESWDDLYDNDDTSPTLQAAHVDAAPTMPIQGDGSLPVALSSRSPEPNGIRKDHEKHAIASEADGDVLIDESSHIIAGMDHNSQAILDETTTIGSVAQVDGALDVSTMPIESDNTIAYEVTQHETQDADAQYITSEGAGAAIKEEDKVVMQDGQIPDIAQDAMAEEPAQDAEFRFDSSDGESDSSDTSSDDSSDEDSDEEYALLDPATAARILMAGDGDDEDGDKPGKVTANHAPRSTNEVKENAAPRPQIEVTPEMQITVLGKIEGIVEGSILIRGHTSGEYQVLEPGSVLCTDSRKVIGAVADLFGRVQEPMYSVLLDESHEELCAELALKSGVEVFYVNDHSKFVFTEPLRGLKGTDASNIHDEEVGEDELEFSDDEQEAEFKRQRKLAKKSGRGNFSRGDFENGERIATSRAPSGPTTGTHSARSDMPRAAFEGALDYDGEGPSDGFYNPLKRPDNLSQLMAGTAPRASADRGRGRGRGRGDRGRGRGGQRGGHDRGRGSHHAAQHTAQHTSQYGFNNAPAAVVPQTAYTTQHVQSIQPQQPQNYQFNGYTFQYGNGAAQASQPQQPQAYYSQQQPQAPLSQAYSGAYVDPNYYAALQAQQYAASQAAAAAYPQHHGQPAYAYPGQPTAPAGTAPRPDLADIMRRLGHNTQQ